MMYFQISTLTLRANSKFQQWSSPIWELAACVVELGPKNLQFPIGWVDKAIIICYAKLKSQNYPQIMIMIRSL